jgi:hypothetical protein
MSIERQQAEMTVENAANFNITGNSEMDEIVWKFLAIPLRQAALINQLEYPLPTIDEDEPEAVCYTDEGLSNSAKAACAKAAIGIGIAAAAFGAGMLIFNGLKGRF